MARREFLQLAKVYKPDAKKPPQIAGWYVSEKLDGTRCFWDGGLSRDLDTELVPWANIIDPKTGDRKKKIKPVSTGLWSRYGNPIMAPDWFLNTLPCVPLDGELWAGRGNFQLCRSICAGDEPDSRFDQIEFAVYGSPAIESVFCDGEIKNPNYHLDMRFEHVESWINGRLDFVDFQALSGWQSFSEELRFLENSIDSQSETVYLHHQKQLVTSFEEKAKRQVEEFFSGVLAKGGEGVVIRDKNAIWTPKRVKSLLKYKPALDDEGKVVGFTSGRKTDKGSKLLGMIGALILDYKGKRLELAGLTNEERQFETETMTEYAACLPGADMPLDFQGEYFKVGDVVSFKYTELTDDGLPKSAHYWRRPMPERTL